jgi:hypothetical protein
MVGIAEGDVLVPILLLVLLGAIVVLGSVYAMQTGHMRSEGARLLAVTVVAVLAVLIWLGAPTYFLFVY